MSTRKDGSSAEQYRQVLIVGAKFEEGYASAFTLLADEVEREGLGPLAAVFRQVSHHLRAQVVKHHAIAGAISADPEE